MAGCEGHQGFDSLQDPNAIGGSYIFFDAGVTATKGALVENASGLQASGNKIGVFGTRPDGAQVFLNHDNNVAQLTYSNGLWSYSPLALWHKGTHNFYAYYPFGNSAIDTSGITAASPYITYTQPTTLSSMVDVMTAAKSAESGNVAFMMGHRLFAFDVIIKNSQTTSLKPLTIKNASITFAGLSSSAKLFFDGSTTNEGGTIDAQHEYLNNANYVIAAPTNASKPTEANLNSGSPFLLLPATQLQFNLSLTVVNAWGETVSFRIPEGEGNQTLSPEGGFIAGKKYQLIVTKTDKGIEFVLQAASTWTSKDVAMEFK